jgi:hypothetical protein
MGAIAFTVRGDVQTARAAGAAYFWRAFRNNNLRNFVFGALLATAGIAFSLKFGAPWMVAVLTVFLVIIVAYFPIFYYGRRWEAAALVKKFPEREIEITNDGVTIRAATARTLALPWNKVNALWEYPDFILLVPGRYWYIWLPRAAIPHEAMEMIRDAQPKFSAFKPILPGLRRRDA